MHDNVFETENYKTLRKEITKELTYQAINETAIGLNQLIDDTKVKEWRTKDPWYYGQEPRSDEKNTWQEIWLL